MSIKIWEAYRIKAGYDHWDVLMKIQDKARANIKTRLRETYTRLVDHWTKDREAFVEAWKAFRHGDAPEESRKPDKMCARDFVWSEYGKQLTKAYKDAFDLDVSVTMRRAGKRFLLIPYPGSGLFHDSLKFMRKMPELEDYHYQDQSDPPPRKQVSAAAWRARKRAWTPLLDEPQWSQMLVLEICSYNGFTNVDPWFDDMAAAVQKANSKKKREKVLKDGGLG